MYNSTAKTNVRCMQFFILLLSLITLNVVAVSDDLTDVIYFVRKDRADSVKNYIDNIANTFNSAPIAAVQQISLQKTYNIYTLRIAFDHNLSFTPRIHILPKTIKMLLSFSKKIKAPSIKNFKHRLIDNLNFIVFGERSLILNASFLEDITVMSKTYSKHEIKIRFKLIKKTKIIIDPGHGGKDSGARSMSGHLEKNVTLTTAIELQRILNRTGRYAAYLTRRNDKFYSVEDRVRALSKQQADVLISLHTDSNPVKSVHGMSVYTLPAIINNPKAISDQYQSNLNRSRELARRIVQYIPNFCKIKNTPCRSSDLKILKVNMPAVLIELGCLSNSIDDDLLHSPEFRHRMNYAILYALDSIFSKQREK